MEIPVICFNTKFSLSLYAKSYNVAAIENILNDHGYKFDSVRSVSNKYADMRHITVYDMTIKNSCILKKLIVDKQIVVF